MLDIARNIAKFFEGWFPRVYRCPAGYWTIAWGHRCAPDHPPVTEAEGEQLLSADLQAALAGVLRCCPGLALPSAPPGALDAVVDFAFNLGVGRLQTSTLRRRINQGDWPAAARELRRWIYGGGRILPGLVARREMEARIIEKGVSQ